MVAQNMIPVCLWLSFNCLAVEPVAHSDANQGSSPPVTIAVWSPSQAGDPSWCLSINSGGTAQLTLETSEEDQTFDFVISVRRMKEIRKAIGRTSFFNLQQDIGVSVPGYDTTYLTITAGRESRRIEFHLVSRLMPLDTLKQAREAVEVLHLIRGTIDQFPQVPDNLKREIHGLKEAQGWKDRRGGD